MNNKGSNLMAACAGNVDRASILKRGAGGATPLESGMDAKLNFGMGHGQSFFSTTPLMGHALSGSQLGQADNTIRKAQRHFADGGKVAAKPKPAGPNLRERKEIRAMIKRGKSDAVATLRSARDSLMANVPPHEEEDEPKDFSGKLEALRQKVAAPVALADGGEVTAAASGIGDPEALYGEYTQLLASLNDPSLDGEAHEQMVERLSMISDQLESMGIDLPDQTE